MARQRQHPQLADAVLVADEREVLAIVGDGEPANVPRDVSGQDFEPAGGRVVVTQGLELLRLALQRLIGNEVHRLAVGREGEAAEAGLAAIDREHLKLAAGHVDHARIRLRGGHVFHHQQPRTIRREIHRAPAAARCDQRAAGAGAGVADPDVAVGAVARGAGVGHQPTVGAEHGSAVLAALAVGEHRRFAFVQVVPEQLPELRAADVLAEHEAGAAGGGRGVHGADRFGIEGELLAHAQRRAHAVRLVGFAETRGNDQAAVGQPAGERGAAGVLVAVELLDQGGRDRRDVLAGAVADDLALDLGLGESRQRGEQRREQDGTVRHGGFPKPGGRPSLARCRGAACPKGHAALSAAGAPAAVPAFPACRRRSGRRRVAAAAARRRAAATPACPVVRRHPGTRCARPLLRRAGAAWRASAARWRPRVRRNARAGRRC